MSFETDVLKPGRGVVYKIDVSLDGFHTISYRWSTAAGIDATYDYDPRILGISTLSRGLGLDHTIETSSVEIVLANEDENCDWLIEQTTVADMLRARFRYYVGIYDPTDTDPLTNLVFKLLGEFVTDEKPRRTVDRVTIGLVDQTSGILASPAVRPSLEDWYAQDPSDTTNPLAGFSVNITSNVPLPLAFGDDYMPAVKVTPSEVPTGTFKNIVPLIVCCTASTAAVTSDDVSELWVEDLQRQFNGQTFTDAVVEVPKTVTDPETGSTLTIWSVQKSSTITVDGGTFQILWVAVDINAYGVWFYPNTGFNVPLSTINNADYRKLLFNTQMSAFWVKGFPFSAMTVTSQATQHPADVLTDLISYYSKGSAADLETVSIARVKAAYKNLSAAGMVTSGDSLADVLSSLVGSFELDVVLTWSGQVGMSAALRDYTGLTASLLSISENDISDFEDSIPSGEQRGAPFNRIAVRDRPQRLLYAMDAINQNFGVGEDDPANTQRSTAWGRVLTREMSIPWMTETDATRGIWFTLSLDATPRPRAVFTTNIQGLLLELGDFFELTWTRNLSDPYSSTVFQVYALRFNAESQTVEVECIWADDSDRPYILDSEALLTRCTGSGLRTATVTDGSGTVTFSSGDLVADGVTVGDTLVLNDATEAATSFKRCKHVKITAVGGALTCTVTDPLDSLNFGTGGVPLAVSTWEIRRSHITYPTALTDFANYPDGGNLYGRVSSSDSNGTFSALGTGGFNEGHKLLDG